MNVGARRLNLADLLIVVAGLAGGLAMGRAFVASGAHRRYNWGSERLAVAEGWSASLMLGSTLAVLMLRARRPRAPWRRLRREPGLLACVIVVATLGVRAAQDALIYYRAGFDSPSFRNALFAGILGPAGYGFAIFVGWGTLAVCGGWRSEAGAIDRMGRAVGWSWIAAFAILPLVHWWIQ